MGPNKYQIVLIVIIAVLWLGVGNLIIYDAIRKKGLSRLHMLNPFILSKIDGKDLLKFILLIITIIGLMFLIIFLETK